MISGKQVFTPVYKSNCLLKVAAYKFSPKVGTNFRSNKQIIVIEIVKYAENKRQITLEYLVHDTSLGNESGSIIPKQKARAHIVYPLTKLGERNNGRDL